MSKFFGKPTEKIIEFMLFFCDFRVSLGFHFGGQGQHKKQHKGVFVGYLFWGGVREGLRVLLGCFFDDFWYPFGSFLVAFGSLWKRGCWNCWVAVGKI